MLFVGLLKVLPVVVTENGGRVVQRLLIRPGSLHWVVQKVGHDGDRVLEGLQAHLDVIGYLLVLSPYKHHKVILEALTELLTEGSSAALIQSSNELKKLSWGCSCLTYVDKLLDAFNGNAVFVIQNWLHVLLKLFLLIQLWQKFFQFFTGCCLKVLNNTEAVLVVYQGHEPG